MKILWIKKEAHKKKGRQDRIKHGKMKSTEVQTLGALWSARVSKRMRRNTNWWAEFILAVTRGLLLARAESDAG